MIPVLLAAADPRTASRLRSRLAADGFAVTVVADGTSVLTVAGARQHRLMVCDSDLPGPDGPEVIAHLRSRGYTLPILLLAGPAAAARWRDTAGPACSGVTVLVRPFRLERLVERVRRMLSGPEQDAGPDLVYGDLRLDIRSCRAFLGDYVVDLSAQECRMTEIFLRQPGRVVSREELSGSTLHDGGSIRSNVVDVHIRNLRRKLGTHRFVTVRGRGYRLDAAP